MCETNRKRPRSSKRIFFERKQESSALRPSGTNLITSKSFNYNFATIFFLLRTFSAGIQLLRKQMSNSLLRNHRYKFNCRFVAYHIGVIPVSWSSVGNNDILVVPVVVDYRLKTLPRVLDVVVISPQIAVLNDGWEIRLRTKRKVRHSCANTD